MNKKSRQETPIPGSYETRNFLADLDERPATYTFKGEGRKKDADTQRKGGVLLPGAYEAHDMLYNLDQTRYTYSMKNTSRDENELPGVKDKVGIEISNILARSESFEFKFSANGVCAEA